MSSNLKKFCAFVKQHVTVAHLEVLWVYVELMLLSWIYAGHLCVWQCFSVCVWGLRGQRWTQAEIRQAKSDTCGCYQSENRRRGRKVGLVWSKMITFAKCLLSFFSFSFLHIMSISKVKTRAQSTILISIIVRVV